MKNKQVTLKEIYIELKNLEKTLQNKGIITELELSNKNEALWDWPEKTLILADESMLKEDWLSQEDEEAWKDL
ncbi:MAG: hypothetical protein AABX80_01565 [Nanoarchaeota archaeon]